VLHYHTATFGGLTPQRVPEAYIRAEVARLPLASEEAFRMALTELHPSLDDKTADGRNTRDLWRKCEELLSEHASGWSLDRLIAIRDFYWFNSNAKSYLPDQPVPLHEYLHNLACKHVCTRPGISEVVTKTENFFEATAHYRWLAFALPEDLLLMSCKTYPPPTYINIDPPLFVKRLLDNGVSEIHQHIGASMDFKILWMSTLTALAGSDLQPDSLSDPEVPFKKSELFFRWLIAGVITRSLLIEYLLCGNRNRKLIDYILELRHIRGQFWNTLEKTLFALRYGDDNMLPSFYSLRDLYQEVHPLGRILCDNPPGTLEEAWRSCDPVAVRLSLSSPNEGEIYFVRKCLAFIEQSESKGISDKMFITLFWQVIRLRNLLYRSVAQRPLTAGLQWFVRFNNRLWPFRTPLDKIRTEVSFDVASGIPGNSIASLEVRLAARDTSKELAEGLCELTESWRNVLRNHTFHKQTPEFGVLLLFAKTRDQDYRWESGNPPAYNTGTHAEPLPGIGSTIHLGSRRFTNYFQSQVRKVKAATELIHKMPSILWLLRGIDVAADELSIPTWVLVPLFRFLERESAFAAASIPDPIKPPPLKITAHVGEDFRHLMEGMRRIFETVHYLLRRSGGRIGHATALGYDPLQWAKQTGSVMMPMEERLWDLVFEWRLYTRFEIPDELRISVPQERIGYLENQIRNLSNCVFAWGHKPHEMALVHHKLHTLWSGPEVNEYQTEVGLNNFTLDLIDIDPDFYYNQEHVRKLIEEYRKSEDVFRRGQQLINIVINDSEINALQAVQDSLRSLVSVRGIVAEVNPSSNLLIGNLMDLRNHPVLRLFPPEFHEEAPPPVRIAIGSDDPITFCTHLLREYTLLYNAALSAGYSEKSVIRWLNDIRCTSMDARFTLKWPNIHGKEMIDKLLEDFDHYLQRPKQYKYCRN